MALVEAMDLNYRLTHDDALKFYGDFDQDQLKAKAAHELFYTQTTQPSG